MSLEMEIKRTANYIDLGITDYLETFKLQQQLVERRIKDEIPDIILISEHFPTVNFGRREKNNTFSDNLTQEMKSLGLEFNEKNAIKYLKEKGIDFSKTPRGGGSTFIGPGQINFYPIVKYGRISKDFFGPGGYLKILDSIASETIDDYGLKTKKRTTNKKDGKDVWIEINKKPFKIMGKGIAFDKGISYHGFNIYVKQGSTKGFRYVNPCGYSNLGAISIEDALGKTIDTKKFKERVVKKIKEKFRYDSINKISTIEI